MVAAHVPSLYQAVNVCIQPRHAARTHTKKRPSALQAQPIIFHHHLPHKIHTDMTLKTALLLRALIRTDTRRRERINIVRPSLQRAFLVAILQLDR
jgi:hypothetical protein